MTFIVPSQVCEQRPRTATRKYDEDPVPALSIPDAITELAC